MLLKADSCLVEFLIAGSVKEDFHGKRQVRMWTSEDRLPTAPSVVTGLDPHEMIHGSSGYVSTVLLFEMRLVVCILMSTCIAGHLELLKNPDVSDTIRGLRCVQGRLLSVNSSQGTRVQGIAKIGIGHRRRFSYCVWEVRVTEGLFGCASKDDVSCFTLSI